MYLKYGKRFFDIICSVFAIFLFSPIMLIVAVLVRIKLGKPIIFKQKREGKNENIFQIYKFRSMTDETDKTGKLLSDEERLTDFGKWLRSSSLDELPELFNILKGDMSFVGPRPLLVRDMVFMSKKQNERHRIRPGLTGVAQIHGRNDIIWEKKLEYDLEYLDNISFWGDIHIIIKTVFQVLKREGIQTEGMETAEDFGDYLLRTGKVGMDNYNKLQKEAIEILRKG